MCELTYPSLSRRRLLTAMALSPLLLNIKSASAAAIDPHRVVALEWLPTELLMALGITPLGVADIDNYRAWVGEPPVPAGVIDVGLRTEPNLELLTQLKPSLLLYSKGYGPSVEKITRIAPGMGFQFNDGSGKLLSVARRSLLELGETLGLRQAALTHLDEFDGFIEQIKPRFTLRKERPLLMMSQMDPRHVLVIGQNSLFQEVLDRLGIHNAWQGETNFWGTTIVGIERLAVMKGVDAICFDHRNDAQMSQMMATPLWKALPFIREGRFTRLPPAWPFGATLSAMNFARMLVKRTGSGI